MPKARFLIPGVLCGILLLASPGALIAATPPTLINYQGVLRSAADEPLTGTYDMTFRFFDAESGGSEILVDEHLAANSQAISVDGGLFSVELGGGAVSDGSGPGTYASLAGAFHDHDEVWLEVQIGAETLAPRTRVVAAAYALNATSAESSDQLGGQPSSFYLDSSSSHQTKSGSIRFEAPDPSAVTVETIADPGSPGAFTASNSYGATCRLAWGNKGADCSGVLYGGYFYDSSDGSYAYTGYASYGVFGVGPGYGGYFSGTGASATGVSASAPAYGGYFSASGSSSTGVYGLSPNYGGHFRNSVSGAEAFIGTGTYGIDAYGTTAGKFYQFNLPGTYTYLGYSGYGVYTKDYNGIHAIDITDSSWSTIGNSPYKVQGTGSVSFVQNHPDDPNEVVIYHAPESSEVNVYTRGSARLVNGEAEIALDPTFAWTANPDIGLTAHLTPRGEPVALAVEEVTSRELKVLGPKGSNVAFDYWVTGLRIGFEEMPAVSPKKFESAIPALASGKNVYDKNPGLRAFDALERYRGMARAVGRAVDPGLKAAGELRDRIGIGRPAAGYVPADDRSALPGASDASAVAGTSEPEPAERSAAAAPGAGPESDPQREVTAPGEARYLPGEMFTASTTIQPGDVVVLDPTVAGAVKRCDAASDRNVVGVAMGPDRDGMVEVAVSAIRDVLVDATDRPIAPGDLLTTSATEGAAMQAPDAAPGTILGKALEPMASGIGTIRVLLMPR